MKQPKFLIHTYTEEDLREAADLKRKVAFTRIIVVLVIAIIALLIMRGCATADTIIIKTLKASWYSNASLKKEGTWKHGETLMANGKRFDENALTCASRLYPLGTMVRIKNLANGKSVVCKVTDRIGKRFATNRIDLSKGCFSKIADLKKGLITVTVTKES